MQGEREKEKTMGWMLETLNGEIRIVPLSTVDGVFAHAYCGMARGWMAKLGATPVEGRLSREFINDRENIAAQASVGRARGYAYGPLEPGVYEIETSGVNGGAIRVYFRVFAPAPNLVITCGLEVISDTGRSSAATARKRAWRVLRDMQPPPVPRLPADPFTIDVSRFADIPPQRRTPIVVSNPHGQILNHVREMVSRFGGSYTVDSDQLIAMADGTWHYYNGFGQWWVVDVDALSSGRISVRPMPDRDRPAPLPTARPSGTGQLGAAMAAFNASAMSPGQLRAWIEHCEAFTAKLRADLTERERVANLPTWNCECGRRPPHGLACAECGEVETVE